jgi:hypothetical protein
MTRPAASRSLIRAHTLMDSEPLMTLFKAPTAGDMDRQLDQMPPRGNKRK